MNKKIKLFVRFFFLISTFHFYVFIAQERNIENGYLLFKKNCTSCHSIDLTKKLIGPPLDGITEKRNRNWLHKWIKNNQLLRKEKDKDAISIYEKYGKIEMNNFPQLSESDIDDILSFIRDGNTQAFSKKEDKIFTGKKIVETTEKFIEKDFIKFIIIGLSIISAILLWILIKIYTLISFLKTKNIENNKIKFTVLKKYKKINKFLIGGAYTVFLYIILQFIMNFDINKGYQPNQPIYFSHKIHAGVNKIDCQYCHSSAKYGKISGIPSANVCMNCHLSIMEYQGKYIENGKNKVFYTGEIKKIYQAVGWNSDLRSFSGRKRPIRWIRIHNMPDFVYFNHSQHVIVGENVINKSKNLDIVCKACHGDVQKMDKIKMVNEFTMGWCINCHRSTGVNFKNKYYFTYFNELHKNIKMTVDAVGGIECAKCHY